ncbi:MAG: hypothetical protein ACQEQ6_07495, partial [Pseudomonadota bacterium]
SLGEDSLLSFLDRDLANELSAGGCLPNELAYGDGIQTLEIMRVGDTITLRPGRPLWATLTEFAKADADF